MNLPLATTAERCQAVLDELDRVVVGKRAALSDGGGGDHAMQRCPPHRGNTPKLSCVTWVTKNALTPVM